MAAPRSLRASLLGFACAFLAAQGCASCEGGVESFVDVPATTDELETWASERGLEADIGRLEKKAPGNVACGHSPACVILIPILVADAVLPSTLKRGSVVDADEKVLYAGVFDLRGRLITARVADGEELRVIERLDLGELGLRPIVEVARVRVNDDGEETARVRTDLVPQVDLVTRYQEELDDESDADDRAKLVLEELRVLGTHEGLEPVMARYRGMASIDDEELSIVVKAACEGHSIGGPELLPLVVEGEGVDSAVAAVHCAHDNAEAAKALVPRVVQAACEDGTGAGANALGSLSRTVKSEVLAAIPECESSSRRTVLLLEVGERPTDGELVAALQDRQSSRLTSDRLRPDRPEDRRVFMAALDSQTGPTKRIAERLARGTSGSPSPEEAKKGASVYAGEIETSEPHVARFHLLRWLKRSNPAALQAALPPLREHASAPHAAAALVLLAGEDQHLSNALDGVEAHEVRPYKWANPELGMDQTNQIAWALHEAGCTADEIERLAREVAAGERSLSCAAL